MNGIILTHGAGSNADSPLLVALAAAFEAAGWDVTDDKRRPLRVLGHFSAPMWLAVRGVAGALPSAVNAVLDALGTRGVGALDLPMSPSRVWAALREAAPSGDIGRPPDRETD